MCQPDQAVWEGSSPKPIPIHPSDERYEVTRLLKPEYHARLRSRRERHIELSQNTEYTECIIASYVLSDHSRRAFEARYVMLKILKQLMRGASKT